MRACYSQFFLIVEVKTLPVDLRLLSLLGEKESARHKTICSQHTNGK